jgi:serine/threonine protein kinase
MASKAIFGPSGKTIEGETEAFCIAKMMRLMGLLGEPEPANQDIVDEFHIARFLEQSTFVRPETGKEEQYVKIGSIREELEGIEGIEKGCVDFILSLLVADHIKRPSAKEALQHPWLQTVEDELD